MIWIGKLLAHHHLSFFPLAPELIGNKPIVKTATLIIKFFSYFDFFACTWHASLYFYFIKKQIK